MRAGRALVLAFALAPSLVACPANDQPEGVEGKEGVALFLAETDTVFTATLVVGSSTKVSVAPVDVATPLAEGARLRSGDRALVTVDEPDEDGLAQVTFAAAGQTTLELADADGTVIDAIDVKAAVPGATTLVDGDLLAASTVVDARLPAEGWGFLVDRELTLMVSAVDRCGGDLLDLHASKVRTDEATPATVTVEPGAPATFTAEASAAGDVGLVLDTPGLELLAYQVQALEGGDVDEVAVSAASADDTGRMSLWGRAYANDVEVVGPLAFSWRADERVALSASTGLAIEVQVSFPAEGEPPDDRPATVTAEVLGEEGTLDLFTAQQQTDRGAPARTVVVEAAPAAGCGGDPCDPFAAAALLGAVALRRRLAALRATRMADG
ncbi:MAG: hypothetical protein HYS27_06880 [Deltaproteobacteria bacterium]|nr:hypothetical protein [Deltaproteobacteria bacterium]